MNSMKSFNLNEYLAKPSGVVTRDGRPARIICTDFNEKFPVVAEIKDCNVPEIFTEEGKYYEGTDTCNDLFFVAEKNEGWINVFRDPNGNCYVVNSPLFTSKGEAERWVKDENYGEYMTTVKIKWGE